MSTLLQTFAERAATQANATAFTVHGAASRRRTWGEWHSEARAFAAALVQGGCMPGEAVAILAGSHEVWPSADMGTLMAGAVSVGVYPTSAAVQVHHILNDCAARVVVVDTEEQLAKVLAVRAALPNLRAIVAAQPTAQVTSWQQWIEGGRGALAGIGAEVDGRSRAAAPDDIAILIYTSGSTGVPKGARISHRYISASAAAIADTLQLSEADSALSFLPYCHAAERVFGLYTRIHCGMSAMLVDAANVWQAARAYQPTLFGGLPRFYEKIYDSLIAKYAQLDEPARVAWDHGLALGRERSLLLRAGREVPESLEMAWLQASSLARSTIAALIGERVRVATSGGATLPAEIGEYLAACGLAVLGAYGLTEHLCAVMHRPSLYGFDSVGPALPGTTLRISDGGEILIERSALTFSGYQNQPAETRAAFTEDGRWLRTGDLGYIDEQGQLHVSGREKELIALSGGKKVAPVPIERRLAECVWISQAVLFGENRKYISALLVLRRSHVEQWAAQQGIAGSYQSLITQPEVLRQVEREIDEVNASLSRPEQIKRFAVLSSELRAETDELTATLKIRRAFVEQKYQTQLEALYS